MPSIGPLVPPAARNQTVAILTKIDDPENKIAGIKAIRTVSQYGLREAKEAFERLAVHNGFYAVPIAVNGMTSTDAYTYLTEHFEFHFDDILLPRELVPEPKSPEPDSEANIGYEPIPQWADGEALLRALGHMDETLTVAQVLSVLGAAI